MTGETSRHMSTPSGRLLSLFHSCPSPLDGIKIQQTTTKTVACRVSPPPSLSFDRVTIIYTPLFYVKRPVIMIMLSP